MKDDVTVNYRIVAEVCGSILIAVLGWLSLTVYSRVDANSEALQSWRAVSEALEKELNREKLYREELDRKVENIERQSIRANYMLERIYTDSLGIDPPSLPPPASGLRK